MLDARALIGSHDILLITLDTLRYDVACNALAQGQTPNLASVLPNGIWEERYTPGNFTYAAHQAFFAGFLPTPITPGNHPRLFALRFEGSETISSNTLLFDTPNIIEGFTEHEYHTVCIGGVGFFNKQNQLGNVLPKMFAESHWHSDLGVTNSHSTENQIRLATEILARRPNSQRLFLFINISALHQPNCIFTPGAESDTIATQTAALAYVDAHLPSLFAAMQHRAPVLAIICSDHGTAYGEGGYFGHRVNHPVVWTVPYAEMILPEVKQ